MFFREEISNCVIENSVYPTFLNMIQIKANLTCLDRLRRIQILIQYLHTIYYNIV